MFGNGLHVIKSQWNHCNSIEHHGAGSTQNQKSNIRLTKYWTNLPHPLPIYFNSNMLLEWPNPDTSTLFFQQLKYLLEKEGKYQTHNNVMLVHTQYEDQSLALDRGQSLTKTSFAIIL